MKSGDAFCRLRSAFPFLVLLKAMLKKTILCFLSVSLLLFFLWIIKLVTGVSINIARIRLSKVLQKRDSGIKLSHE